MIENLSQKRFSHLPTFRTVAILTLVLILLTGPIPKESDLFSAVIGYSLLAFILITVSATFVLGWWYKKKTTYSLTHDLSKFPDGKSLSRTDITTFPVSYTHLTLPTICSV